MARTRSSLEEKFAAHWRMFAADQPTPEREYRFHPTRQWRFDFAWPAHRVAVEIEGGIFVHGGHNRGVIYTKNCEKYNAATIAGWRVLRYTTIDLRKRPAQIIKEITTLLAEGPVVEADRQGRLLDTF